ncbi:MAG: DUF2007 domain-containing protein [Caldicoprobacterales bacterium]|jgi:hypothetical protein|nr:DUF2007 domain-containing protein [Clostridiales bacterium]
MTHNMDDINIIKLKSVSNEIELGMIRSILDDNDIPYLLKDHGSGGHMRIIAGGSIFGTDVMVEETDFDKAKSLLESIGID